MKIGFNLLLWTTNLVEKDFHLLEQLKNAGYDGVEIPIFEGKVEHYKKINKVFTKKYQPYQIGFISREKSKIKTFGKLEW